MNANWSNGCKQCGRDFGGLGAFDKHQDVDYKRQPVIICRDPATLGMHQDGNGRWRMESTGTPFWRTAA